MWGSYWEDGHWGYSCCHSLIKMSYCTGLSGRIARKVITMIILIIIMMIMMTEWESVAVTWSEGRREGGGRSEITGPAAQGETRATEKEREEEEC